VPDDRVLASRGFRERPDPATAYALWEAVRDVTRTAIETVQRAANVCARAAAMRVQSHALQEARRWSDHPGE
jgi:hypothetical protein